jgi:hypothetical protein
MLRIALPLQQSRLTVDSLKMWIRIIEKPIFELDSGGILPPTSHKAMDAVLLLLPLPTDLTCLIYESLVRMACNQIDNPRLTDIALDHIIDLCHRVPDGVIPTLFVLSENLFRLKGARKLLLEFVQKDVQVPEEIIEDVARSLMALGQSDVELRDNTAGSVLKLFLRLQDETKLQYLAIYRDSPDAILQLLSRYCDPRCEAFSEAVAALCTKPAIACLAAILPVCTKEEALIEILRFIRRLATHSALFDDAPSGSLHFHLTVLLPVFADLVLHANPEVRKQLRKILLIIAERK